MQRSAEPASSAKGNRISINISWLMAGEAAGRILSLFSTIYLARVLGSSGFGLFSFASAFLVYGMLLTDFGLASYGTREVARRPEGLNKCIEDVQSSRFSLAVSLCVISSLISVLVIHDPQIRALFIFSFLNLIPYSLGLDWAFRGLERMGFTALWNVVQQSIFLILVYLVISSGKQVSLVPVCKAIGVLVSAVLLARALGRKTGQSIIRASFRRPSWNRILPMLKVGIPLGAASLMVQVYWNLDAIMLGVMDKPAAVGVYSAAYKVVGLSAALCYNIINAFYPSLSRSFRHNPMEYRRKLKLMFGCVTILGICLSTGTYFLRNVIATMVFGAGYGGASVALSVLSMAIIGDFLISAFFISLVAAGQERISLIIVMIGAVSNLCLNLFLIPRYSFVGAAMATVFSYALMAIVCIPNIHRILPRNVDAREQE